MHTKRSGERRQYSAAKIFPLTDTNGCIVAINRSHVPDRRLQNYQVSEINLTEIAVRTINDDR